MKKEYYANGKLLLTGEYAVLDGALALALPTTYGQSLTITPTMTPFIEWASLDEKDEIWFRCKIALPSLKIETTTASNTAERLLQILNKIKTLNPEFLSNAIGIKATTKLTFPKDWGLGSSSTLIYLLSQWGKVNPYEVLRATFGGSGYDIACAKYSKPILFRHNEQEPLVTEIDFKPDFSNQLFFIYLNKKKNSRDAINAYRKLDMDKDSLISKIDTITANILKSTTLSTFEHLLVAHEELLARILNVVPVKQLLFPDYYGYVKSLGAWGGDFILATGDHNTPSYFKKLGYDTVIPYSKMIL